MKYYKNIDYKMLIEDNIFRIAPFLKPIIVKGNGSYVWDTKKKKFLDINSGQFCLSFGYNYKPFNRIILKQLKKIHHTNTLTLTEEVLSAAKKISIITDNKLEKSIFLSTGAEAVEFALRYAKFISGKSCIISLNKGYHGLTIGTQSITMDGIWARPRVRGSISVPTPNHGLCDSSFNNKDDIYSCINVLEKEIIKKKEDVAAIIMELALGVGGVIFLPKLYIESVARLCNKYNILLLIDECQTGFGRTGKWFLFQHYNIVPDMLITSKAMGLGLPVSAVTLKKEIARKIENKIIHFSSHQNDPLSAKITDFMINEIENKNMLTIIRDKGLYFLKELKKLENEFQIMSNARGKGLMLGIDINHKVENYQKLSSMIISEMQKNGVFVQAIRQGRTFRIMPNYLIKYKDIDFFMSQLRKSLNSIMLSRNIINSRENF
jgi:2,2-dialkylglycine decarboxylase (pyruvate)